MIDVDKLLQLDYLNDLIMQLRDSVDDKKKLFVSKYSFETLLELSIEEVNELFNKYGVSNENYIKYLDSDFLDESWEFADLYSDDINYSFEQKEKLKELALSEIIEINNKVDEENDKIQEEIDILSDYLNKLNIFYKALNDDDLIIDEEVDQLKEFIMTYPLIEDDERFKLSINVIKYLITSGKIILLKKELVNTDGFNDELNKIYNDSLVKEDKKIKKQKDSPYKKFIEDYYKKYKFLFDEQGYNDIFELMVGVGGLFNEITDDTNSFVKSIFCIKVAALLCQLNYCDDEDVAQDILTKLLELDDFYSEDSELSKFKIKYLKKIDEFIKKLSDSKFKSFDDRIRLLNRLNILKIELENNIFNKKRKKTFKEEFETLYSLFVIMLENIENVEKINHNCDKVNELLNDSDIASKLGNDLYNELVSVQEKMLKLQKTIKKKSVDKEISSKLQICMDTLVKVDNKLNSSSDKENNFNINGFVLFDINSDGNTYVLNDFDLSDENNLIDSTIKSEKLNKGYENYSKLISDLHIIGNVEKLSNDDSNTKSSKLCEPIFSDLDKTQLTNMIVLKEEVSGVEKFVCQKIVLEVGSVMYEQVTNIIKELLPNVILNASDKLYIYLCFVSAMKVKSEDIYEISMNRYSSEKSLSKLFAKDSLTEEELGMLKEYIQLTLNTYLELEKINPKLNFEDIKHIGGLD